jgi:hypothetical protein
MRMNVCKLCNCVRRERDYIHQIGVLKVTITNDMSDRKYEKELEGESNQLRVTLLLQKSKSSSNVK